MPSCRRCLEVFPAAQDFYYLKRLTLNYNDSMTSKKSKVGSFLGIPYDWRKPTKARFKSRVWNPNAPFVNPRWYGWGYDINFYVVFHPVQARRNRQKN